MSQDPDDLRKAFEAATGKPSRDADGAVQWPDDHHIFDLVSEPARPSEGFVRVQQVVRELAKTVERMADDEDSVCVVATADEHRARVVAGAAYRRVADMLRAEIEKLPNVRVSDDAPEAL